MATEKIILDVDTGSDDAVAIICAALSSKIELHSICTVWGNRPLDQTGPLRLHGVPGHR